MKNQRKKRYDVIEAGENPRIVGSFDDYYEAQVCMSENTGKNAIKTFIYDRVRGMYFDPDEIYSRAIAAEATLIISQNIGMK